MNTHLFFRPPKAVSIFIILLSMSFSTISTAAPAYARIVDSNGVAIPGEVILSGKEGTIEIQDYSHNVSAAYDDATGLLTGNRQHRPVRLVKLVDAISPVLFGLMSGAETLQSVTIELWKPVHTIDWNYATVVLHNAHIVSIISHKSDSSDAILESVSLTYESITINNGVTNTETTTDTWVTP